MSLPEKTKELKTILPAEILTKSTPEGITALARAACWCSQDMYTGIFMRVAKAVNDPNDPQPLDPFLVNSIWLDETASREKALVNHLSVKTAVLTHLLKEHFVVEANPSITCEELRDAIEKRRQETNYDSAIPIFSHSFNESYNEPPYFFLMAQIQLNQSQGLVDDCLKKLAKKSNNKGYYTNLVGRPFSQIQGEARGEIAELLAEEFKQSRRY